MNCTYKGSLGGALKLLTVATLSMFLVACSSGGTGDGTDSTFDGDDDFGIDGDDDFGLGDNEFDEFEEFEEDNFDAGTLDACDNQGGTDTDSSDFLWRNNCTLGVSIAQSASFYDSTYAEGIQRIMYCSGVADAADDAAYTNGIASFADGKYGNKTKEAVRAFQQAENAYELASDMNTGFSRGQLVVDGIVGPETWERLQSKVELYEDENAFIQFDGDFEVFGVLTSTNSFGVVDCTSDRHFYGYVGDNTSGIQSWMITDSVNSSVTKGFGINAL